jgi:hypothetical protein
MTLFQRNHRYYLWFALALLMLLLVSGCSRVVTGGFFTLASGETISGNLWVPFGKVELQEGSQVTGSVLMLCCSLTVDGKADADIFLTFGDLSLGSSSEVNGDVVLLSGLYQREAGSNVGGMFTSSMTPGIYRTIVRPFQICLASIVVIILVLVIVIILMIRRKKRRIADGNPNSRLLEQSNV